MSARYIVRLDDACETMDHYLWEILESTLDELNIQPIVGVVPINKDKRLNLAPPSLSFWNKVREWDSKGWSIAMHGYSHQHHEISSVDLALLPLHTESEFVGLDLDAQRTLIKESWKIFLENGVKPSIFMAPSHSFDLITLEALKLETDIRILTDGYATYPFYRAGFIWIPQQLWRFRYFWWGIWTVCYHPNNMKELEMQATLFDIRKNRVKIISVNDVLKIQISKWGILNKVIEYTYIRILIIRRLFKINLKKFN